MKECLRSQIATLNEGCVSRTYKWMNDLTIIKVVVLYFPEKGCHLGTNRSDNET